MSKSDEKAVIISKKKNIQLVFDYCVEQKITFQASPRAISPDEWEVELEISTMKQAIALGMFAKENKLDMPGFAELNKAKANASPKKSEEKNSIEPIIAPVKEEVGLGLI